jgi:hypothetical protein
MRHRVDADALEVLELLASWKPDSETTVLPAGTSDSSS